MTLGELSLQREVLALFDRQADMLLPRIRARRAGGGRGVGPHLEGLGGRHRRLQGRPRRGSGRAGRGGDRDAAVAAAIDTLAAVLEEAKAEIARLLRD